MNEESTFNNTKSHDEIEAIRRRKYRELVDPITCEIARLQQGMLLSNQELDEDETNELNQLNETRNKLISAIKNEYKYPEEDE